VNILAYGKVDLHLAIRVDPAVERSLFELIGEGLGNLSTELLGLLISNGARARELGPGLTMQLERGLPSTTLLAVGAFGGGLVSRVVYTCLAVLGRTGRCEGKQDNGKRCCDAFCPQVFSSG
jgi:hypothetical protein